VEDISELNALLFRMKHIGCIWFIPHPLYHTIHKNNDDFTPVFSIVNEEPNAEEAKAKVKAYEEANRSQIVIRQSQRADEERCIADRIASEQRQAERRKREFQEIEKAVTAAKQKFKQETTEVMLGERDQVSAEVAAAQMLGYRNELIRQQRGRGQISGAGPRVREPEGGLGKDKVKDREMYRKRQAAGGGITSENIAVQERDWQLTFASLFARPHQWCMNVEQMEWKKLSVW